MKTVMIKLDSIMKVKEFVDITNFYAGDVEISEGKYTVNAKSVMGILSLNLKNNLRLHIKSGKNLSALICELEPYMVV